MRTNQKLRTMWEQTSGANFCGVNKKKHREKVLN